MNREHDFRPLILTKVLAEAREALFNEFDEIGVNKQRGYHSPADLRADYPQFFWTAVGPFIGDALRYLSVTQEGKLWISNLYAHVFSQEHHMRLAQMGHNRSRRASH